MPKSRTFRCSRPAGRPSTSIRFDGFRSRWTIPWLVRHLEHVAELLEDAGRPVQGHRDAGLEHLVEALAADVLHLDVGDVPLVSWRRGPSTALGWEKPGHDPRLAPEPVARLGVVGDARRDQLQGPLDVELQVPDQPDLAHPPSAELALDQVLAEEDLPRLELAGCLGGQAPEGLLHVVGALAERDEQVPHVGPVVERMGDGLDEALIFLEGDAVDVCAPHPGGRGR